MFIIGKKKQLVPSDIEQWKFEADAKGVSDLYSGLGKLDDLNAFLTQREIMHEYLSRTIDFQKKYSQCIKGGNTPMNAYNKIKSERSETEKKFIDRYIVAIKRKMLDYKTPRGKTNNRNVMIDKFMFDSNKFLPESVEYFKKLVKDNFDISL